MGETQRGTGAGGEGGGGGWIPCVPARTKDKRRRRRRRLSFVSSVICLAVGFPPLPPVLPPFPSPFLPDEPVSRGGRGAHPVERMREIWGCMVRKATFECHRKGAERSFISPALSCHLRDPSTLHGHDGTLNFRSGPPAGSGKRWPGIFLSLRGEAGPCSFCAR